ncbi:hypothetical protein Trydic_g5611 [Trypoxylus dichotomus]
MESEVIVHDWGVRRWVVETSDMAQFSSFKTSKIGSESSIRIDKFIYGEHQVKPHTERYGEENKYNSDESDFQLESHTSRNSAPQNLYSERQGKLGFAEESFGAESKTPWCGKNDASASVETPGIGHPNIVMKAQCNATY